MNFAITNDNVSPILYVSRCVLMEIDVVIEPATEIIGAYSLEVVDILLGVRSVTTEKEGFLTAVTCVQTTMDVVRELERRALGLCRLPNMVVKTAYPIVLVLESRDNNHFDAVHLLNRVLSETGLICGSTILASLA